MGFFSNLWNKAKSTARKIGSFVEEKAKPMIGKISGAVKKVAHEINSNPAIQGVLDGLSTVPIVGRLAQAVKVGSKYAERGADIAQNAVDLSDQVNTAVRDGVNAQNAKAIFDAGKNLHGQGKQFRDDIKAGEIKNSAPLRGPALPPKPVKREPMKIRPVRRNNLLV